MADLTELKQACLDLSNAAIELFDRFEQHGFEAAWEGDGVLVVKKVVDAEETLRRFFQQQSTTRLLAMGVTPEQLLKNLNRR